MTPLDRFDPLPVLGPVHVPEKEAEDPDDDWVQIPGAINGVQRNKRTGFLRNHNTEAVLVWPFG